MKNTPEKIGSIGAIIAAAACPICFPKLALIGAFLGLGALAPFETGLFYGAQALCLLALVGHFVSYKKHRNWKILVLAGISVALLFISLYAFFSEALSYLAFIGLIAATIWLIMENRRCEQCGKNKDTGQAAGNDPP